MEGKRQEYKKICIIGSGNWGSTVAKIVGENVLRRGPEIGYDRVTMWVYHELCDDGCALADVINERRVNVKYLPGVQLPAVISATSCIVDAVAGASLILLVQPQQFLESACAQIAPHVPPGAVAVSLIKGISYDPATKSLLPLTSKIASLLPNLGAVGALMGANIADEVARELFSEATLAVKPLPNYAPPSSPRQDKERNQDEPPDFAAIRLLFDRPYFRVRLVDDLVGVELCGVLKNIVALAAGMVDGLGWGSNAKAAIIRIGVAEIRAFAAAMFPASGVSDSTFFESCGIADVITTCYGGRHRMIGEAFAREHARPASPRPVRVDELERTLLKGQKLQGTVALLQIRETLGAAAPRFPLFCAVHEILFAGAAPASLIDKL